MCYRTPDVTIRCVGILPSLTLCVALPEPSLPEHPHSPLPSRSLTHRSVLIQICCCACVAAVLRGLDGVDVCLWNDWGGFGWVGWRVDAGPGRMRTRPERALEVADAAFQAANLRLQDRARGAARFQRQRSGVLAGRGLGAEGA